METARMAGVLVATAFIWGVSLSRSRRRAECGSRAPSESQAALQQLYAAVPLAKELGPKAHAILVFPKVKKAGLGIGGQYGEGTC